MKRHGAIRVMVVDDDDMMRAGIAAILADDEIQVIAQADDGVTAVRRVANDMVYLSPTGTASVIAHFRHRDQ